MKQTVNFTAFVDAFKVRERYNQFGGYDGLKALFDYLEYYEESTGEEIELDVIGLCCEYTYYGTVAEYNEDYEAECESMKDVEEVTTVIPIDDEAFICANW